MAAWFEDSISLLIGAALAVGGGIIFFWLTRRREQKDRLQGLISALLAEVIVIAEIAGVDLDIANTDYARKLHLPDGI